MSLSSEAMDCLYVSKLNFNSDWYDNPFLQHNHAQQFFQNQLSWSDKNIIAYSPQKPICILDKSTSTYPLLIIDPNCPSEANIMLHSDAVEKVTVLDWSSIYCNNLLLSLQGNKIHIWEPVESCVNYFQILESFCLEEDEILQAKWIHSQTRFISSTNPSEITTTPATPKLLHLKHPLLQSKMLHIPFGSKSFVTLSKHGTVSMFFFDTYSSNWLCIGSCNLMEHLKSTCRHSFFLNHFYPVIQHSDMLFISDSKIILALVLEGNMESSKHHTIHIFEIQISKLNVCNTNATPLKVGSVEFNTKSDGVQELTIQHTIDLTILQSSQIILQEEEDAQLKYFKWIPFGTEENLSLVTCCCDKSKQKSIVRKWTKIETSQLFQNSKVWDSLIHVEIQSLIQLIDMSQSGELIVLALDNGTIQIRNSMNLEILHHASLATASVMKEEKTEERPLKKVKYNVEESWHIEGVTISPNNCCVAVISNQNLFMFSVLSKEASPQVTLKIENFVELMLLNNTDHWDVTAVTTNWFRLLEIPKPQIQKYAVELYKMLTAIEETTPLFMRKCAHLQFLFSRCFATRLNDFQERAQKSESHLWISFCKETLFLAVFFKLDSAETPKTKQLLQQVSDSYKKAAENNEQLKDLLSLLGIANWIVEYAMLVYHVCRRTASKPGNDSCFSVVRSTHFKSLKDSLIYAYGLTTVYEHKKLTDAKDIIGPVVSSEVIEELYEFLCELKIRLEKESFFVASTQQQQTENFIKLSAELKLFLGTERGTRLATLLPKNEDIGSLLKNLDVNPILRGHLGLHSSFMSSPFRLKHPTPPNSYFQPLIDTVTRLPLKLDPYKICRVCSRATALKSNYSWASRWSSCCPLCSSYWILKENTSSSASSSSGTTATTSTAH